MSLLGHIVLLCKHRWDRFVRRLMGQLLVHLLAGFSFLIMYHLKHRPQLLGRPNRF